MADTNNTTPKAGTKAHFATNARMLDVVVDGRPMVAEVKEFSTGSVGWYATGKISVTLADGTKVAVQMGLNLTVVGSKEWPAK